MSRLIIGIDWLEKRPRISLSIYRSIYPRRVSRRLIIGIDWIEKRLRRLIGIDWLEKRLRRLIGIDWLEKRSQPPQRPERLRHSSSASRSGTPEKSPVKQPDLGGKVPVKDPGLGGTTPAKEL
jgi:hypothetical protein